MISSPAPSLFTVLLTISCKQSFFNEMYEENKPIGIDKTTRISFFFSFSFLQDRNEIRDLVGINSIREGGRSFLCHHKTTRTRRTHSRPHRGQVFAPACLSHTPTLLYICDRPFGSTLPIIHRAYLFAGMANGWMRKMCMRVRACVPNSLDSDR